MVKRLIYNLWKNFPQDVEKMCTNYLRIALQSPYLIFFNFASASRTVSCHLRWTILFSIWSPLCTLSSNLKWCNFFSILISFVFSSNCSSYSKLISFSSLRTRFSSSESSLLTVVNSLLPLLNSAS